MKNNYRVTFLHDVQVDYWKNFKAMNLYYPIVDKILNKAKALKVKQIWFFYEPFIEITWLGTRTQAKNLFKFVEKICKENNIYDLKKLTPQKNGQFADWFRTSDDEEMFGCKRHDVCRQWVQAYNEHKDSVDNGKGLEEQIARTIHTLCNPLGLNYLDEARICFRRAAQCYLYTKLPFGLARFIYSKILRLK